MGQQVASLQDGAPAGPLKGTMLLLNGQNLKLVAKNGRAAKTLGRHPSAGRGKDWAQAGPPPPPPALLEPLQGSPGPRPDRGPDPGLEEARVRRPPALAPLELPEEVREAQRQKLKLSAEPGGRPPPCKADPETLKKKARSCAGQRAPKPPACPAEPLKSRNRSPRPRLARCEAAQANSDWSLEGVVCRGTPAPLHNKPPALLPALRVRAGRQRSPEEGRRSSTPLLLDGGGGRRPRLRRAQCLEEDQQPGLAQKPCPGERAKGQGHTGKSVQEAPSNPWEPARVRRGRPAGGQGEPRPTRVALRRQSAEGGSSGDPHGKV